MSHGGVKYDILAPRSKLYQGPFGRICPDLPPWVPPGQTPDETDAALLAIAQGQMIERPGIKPKDLANPTVVAELEAEFGSTIPAGYTYFGQFIDHDITFDPASSLMRRNDPNGLVNFRTPRLDLDNVYGRGRGDQPYLYDQDDKDKLAWDTTKTSSLRDLPRFRKRALIGDMRNDENAMVSQLQLAFHLAHNTLVERARIAGHDDAFESAKNTLRWLYQHIVWNDFVKRIVNNDTHACALSLVDACGGRKRWDLGLKDVFNWKHQPFMPVEFSVAAYRFGHSMVRNAYQTNAPHRGFQVFAPIFDNSGGAPGPDDLRGFTEMVDKNVIQWDWFLEMTTSAGPFPQRARKIDTKLSNALSFLHEAPSGDPLNVLAFRNLKRSVTFELPPGTAVARKFCIEPVELAEDEPDALWFYVLKEAGTLPGANAGNMLGPVGSIIVAAVFAGLLKGDPRSFFNMAPCWTPGDDPLLCDGVDNVDDPAWGLPSIIRLAGLPVDGGDVTEQTGGNYPDTVACVAAALETKSAAAKSKAKPAKKAKKSR